MPQLIISYSRRDAGFVDRLHHRLAQGLAGTRIWLDRDDSPSRMRSFRAEYADAAAASDRMLLVVSEAAVTSAEVAFEWRTAIECCLPVVPILLEQTVDLVPKELRELGVNIIDFANPRSFEEAVSQLLGVLREAVLPLAPIPHVPELPPHFWPRPESLTSVRRMLLPENRGPTVITAATRTTGLFGMGGVGKSVLAAWFARQCDTRRTFTDGVFWLSFGRAPSMERNLAALERQIGLSLQAPDGVGAVRGRRCLVVLDDVWRVQDVAPFRNMLGARSRLLVTTRDASITRGLGAEQVPLGLLDEHEARELLAGWVGEPAEQMPDVWRDIVRHAGRLPVAIAMAGAMIGSRPDGWVAAIGRFETSDLARIHQDFPDYPYPDLLQVVEVSVAALAEDLASTSLQGCAVRHRYGELAVFGEDVPFTAGAAALAWGPSGLAPADAQDLLARLVDRSLLARDARSRFKPHDLQYDFMRGTVRDLPSMHRRLIDAYSALCTVPGAWWTAPDHGYFHDRLALHLAKARRLDALHALLDSSTPGGQNAWHEVSERGDRIEGYAADLRFAWKHARGIRDRKRRITFDARYALMLSSLSSTSSNVPPSLAAALVREGLWTPKRALAAARHVADPADRAEALIEQVAGQPVSERSRLQDEALSTLTLVTDGKQRARLIATLLDALPSSAIPALAHRLLDLVSSRAAPEHYYAVLELLEPHLSDVSASGLMAGLDAIHDPEWRLRALALVARRLDEGQQRRVHDEILREVRASEPGGLTWSIIATLAASRTGQEREELLQQAEWYSRGLIGDMRSDALLEIACQHEGAQRLPLLVEAAQPLSDEAPMNSAERLAGYAPRLRDEERIVLVDGMRRIGGRYSRTIGLCLLAPSLPTPEREMVAAEAWREGHEHLEQMPEWDRSSAATLLGSLARLAGDLDEAARAELHARIGRIHSAGNRARAWTRCAASSRGDDRAEAVDRSLDAIHSIPHQRDARECLAELGPLLNRDQAARGWRMAVTLREQGGRINGLQRLLPYLDHDERERMQQLAIDVIEAYQDDTPGQVGSRQARDLQALASDAPVSSAVWRRLVDVASRIGDVRYRTEAMAEMSLHAPPDLHAHVVQNVIELASSLHSTDPYWQATYLLLPLPALDPDLRRLRLAELRRTLNTVSHPAHVVELTARAMRWVPREHSASWLDEAVRALLSDLKRTAKSIETLEPYFTGELVDRLRHHFARSSATPPEIVVALANWLAEHDRGDEALEFIEQRTVESPSARVAALRAVGPHLAAAVLDRFADLAAAVDYEPTRNDISLMLCRRAVELGDSTRAIAIARSLGAFQRGGDAMAVAALATVCRLVPRSELDAEALLLSRLAELGEHGSVSQVLNAVVQPGHVRLHVLERGWFLLLHQLSFRPRADVLQTLYGLGPVMEALGGRQGVGEIAAAIRQVVAWWP